MKKAEIFHSKLELEELYGQLTEIKREYLKKNGEKESDLAKKLEIKPSYLKNKISQKNINSNLSLIDFINLLLITEDYRPLVAIIDAIKKRGALNQLSLEDVLLSCEKIFFAQDVEHSYELPSHCVLSMDIVKILAESSALMQGFHRDMEELKANKDSAKIVAIAKRCEKIAKLYCDEANKIKSMLAAQTKLN